MRLAIRHRTEWDAAFTPDLPAWRTCLREVVFLDPIDVEPDAPADVSVDGQAYGLLLEILCGLRSPMVGETEVMGQFKAFLRTLPDDHAAIRRFGQRILADAGTVRERHLRGLGSRSYGSAVRRLVPEGHRIALIGTGQLATKILPFLIEEGREIDQWGRKKDAMGFPVPGSKFPVRVRVLGGPENQEPAPERGTWNPEPRNPVPTVLVVAALAPARVVEDVASAYCDLRLVIDLRGESTEDPVTLDVPVVTLQDVFRDVDAARRRAADQTDAARREIRRLSREFDRHTDIRPFGWDDLCA